MRTYLKSKIHRATVTHADLDYEGSITIDKDLMEAVNIDENEQVHVWNVTNGERLITYAIPGDSGSGVIGINGAGAHLCKPNDIVIIAAFGIMSSRDFVPKPKIIFMDENNVVK